MKRKHLGTALALVLATLALGAQLLDPGPPAEPAQARSAAPGHTPDTGSARAGLLDHPASGAP